jgi:hypothetical protein
MPDNGATDKSDEFIELYNNSNKVLPANSLQLQIYSSTATDWSDKPYRSITLSQDFLPGKHYLVASNNYLKDMAYDFYGSSLAAGLGHVRVIDIASQAQEDFVEWGNGGKNHVLQAGNTFAPTLTYPADAAQSLKRKVNEDGVLVYSGISGSDFMVSSAPSPEADNVAPDGFTIVADTADDAPVVSDPVEAVPTNLVLTELLPDPVSPQTDEADEFIELYNGGSEAVNIKGYTLETDSGSTVHDYSFTSDMLIASDTYQVFLSAETHLALSNSGSQVRLLDPAKAIISETTAYPAAEAGQAWAISSGAWQWTATPTPGLANTITAAQVTPKAVKAAKVTKPPKAKKLAVKKTAAKKKKVVKSASFDNTAAAVASAPVHTKILVGVALGALLYGLYEYRHDLSNRFHVFWTNRAARRAARQEPKGRRSLRASQ